MSIPATSPPTTYTCFSCQKPRETIFAKINRSALQYPICNPACLTVALTRLGLINSEDRDFTSPVNISVRQSPCSFVNSERQVIQRSPGNPNLDKLEDTDVVNYDPEGLQQIRQLAKTTFIKE